MSQEKGSMAVFVGIVLLGMLFIVMSVFLISNNSLQTQAKSLIKIKEAYEADVNNVDEIYGKLTGTSTDEPQYVTDGLVLHYDAINNTGNGHSNTATTWKDLSGNGNDGTLSTSPTTSNFYWEDNSITIANHDGQMKYYVDTPLNLSENERTYIYTVDTTNLSGTIWGETDSNNLNGMFNYYTFIANRSTDFTGQSRFDYTFSKEGVYWYAVSLSSNQMKFYENGKLVTVISNTCGLKSNNTLRLLAARYSRENQNATNLKMYNFMAYSRVLTDEEIQNNFTVDKAKYNIISDSPRYVTDGLVLHYDAINNTGNGHSSTTTTWKDLSGNGNDGTLSANPNNSIFYWENNSLTIANHDGQMKYYVDTPLNLSGQERTYIYTVDATNLTGTIWGETNSSNLNGLFNYYQFISNRANSTSGDNRYNYTFAKSGIYCYAISVSSSEIKFYENGELVTTLSNTVGLNCSNNLRLLAGRHSTQNASNLKMYNFMAYNRVLTDSEVIQNYNMDKEKYNF